MKKWLVFAALAFPVVGMTQSIDQQDLEKIRSGFVKDNYTEAMQNALSSNPITDIAWSRKNEGTTDHYFTYRVDVKGITNQKKSGRCWLFTSLNVFRPMAMQHFNVASFEFSENYLYFWDIFEKANLFLNNIAATADKDISDQKVQALVLRDMKNDGKSDAKIESTKVEMMGVIYRMLALNLGEPPTTFSYRFKDKSGNVSEAKEYTPHSFMQEVLGDIQLSDYVMLMNDPSRPYWKHYEIENYRNVEEGENWHYVNLPNDVIKQFCITSIKSNEALYTSSDVGKQLRRDFGVLDVDNFNYEAVYNVPFQMNKADRIKTSDSGSSHAMALIAVEVDQNEKPVKWQFENSWGESSGEKGYLTFTDRWFDEYMFRIVVNKKYIIIEKGR